MKFCKKCHRRVMANEKFGGYLDYFYNSGKFCQCLTNIAVMNDESGCVVLGTKARGRRGVVKSIETRN